MRKLKLSEGGNVASLLTIPIGRDRSEPWLVFSITIGYKKMLDFKRGSPERRGGEKEEKHAY